MLLDMPRRLRQHITWRAEYERSIDHGLFLALEPLNH
jgi:hypothetical protein